MSNQPKLLDQFFDANRWMRMMSKKSKSFYSQFDFGMIATFLTIPTKIRYTDIALSDDDICIDLTNTV